MRPGLRETWWAALTPQREPVSRVCTPRTARHTEQRSSVALPKGLARLHVTSGTLLSTLDTARWNWSPVILWSRRSKAQTKRTAISFTGIYKEYSDVMRVTMLRRLAASVESARKVDVYNSRS